MTEEEAFVAGICEHPLDDLRRLVFADWLDERGRTGEADYLRLVAALAATPAVDVKHPHAIRLLELADRLDHTWREATGGRFDLWVEGNEGAKAIEWIKRVRQVLGCGLAHAKQMWYASPLVLASGQNLEMLLASLAAFDGSGRQCRMIPTQANSPPGLFPLKIVIRWEAMYHDFVPVSTEEQTQSALEHMRRILATTTETAAEVVNVPGSLGVGEYKFEIAVGIARSTTEISGWQHRLLGGRFFAGNTADPPFSGVIEVNAVWR